MLTSLSPVIAILMCINNRFLIRLFSCIRQYNLHFLWYLNHCVAWQSYIDFTVEVFSRCYSAGDSLLLVNLTAWCLFPKFSGLLIDFKNTNNFLYVWHAFHHFGKGFDHHIYIVFEYDLSDRNHWWQRCFVRKVTINLNTSKFSYLG